MIQLPNSVTGNQPTGLPETLRAVRPTVMAPSPTDPKASAHAIGSHVLRLPRGYEARPTRLDGVPVLLARHGKQVHVFADSIEGVVEVVGLSADQVEGIREWLDAAAVAPASELEALLERISERFPERRTLDAKATDRDTKRALKLIGLSATEDREVDRYLTLAAELDDGGASGGAEVDRLVRLAENLSDG